MNEDALMPDNQPASVDGESVMETPAPVTVQEISEVSQETTAVQESQLVESVETFGSNNKAESDQDETVAQLVPPVPPESVSSENSILSEDLVLPVDSATVSDSSAEYETEKEQESVDSVTVLTPALDTINEHLEQLSDDLSSLVNRFDKRMQYDEAKEKIIDRQHSELERLRDGLKQDLLRPVLYDVAETLDEIRKIKDDCALKDDGQMAVSVLKDVEDMLGYVLEKNDVEIISSEEGDQLVAGRQRIIKTVQTEDESKQRTVAQSIAPGYLYGKETLFKEKVTVYKFVPASRSVDQLEDSSQPSVENTTHSGDAQ